MSSQIAGAGVEYHGKRLPGAADLDVNGVERVVLVALCVKSLCGLLLATVRSSDGVTWFEGQGMGQDVPEALFRWPASSGELLPHFRRALA